MRKTYRVYFSDGNQKLFEANNTREIMIYLQSPLLGNYKAEDVCRIEEVTQ